MLLKETAWGSIMYKPKYFSIKEYVPPQVYADRGERAWELLDDRLLMTDDALRERYGRIIINNWHSPRLIKICGGDVRSWSGLRTEESPYGSEYSQHRFGRASDKLFLDTHIDVVRNDILLHQDEFPYINFIELKTSWLHSDTRNCERIKIYTPRNLR